MPQDVNPSLRDYCDNLARRAREAAAALSTVTGQHKTDWLLRSARQLREQAGVIEQANAQDLAAAPGYGLTDAQIDRLRLTAPRIDEIARALEEVAALPDPVGRVIESSIRPNGIEVQKVRVPIGVIFGI